MKKQTLVTQGISGLLSVLMLLGMATTPALAVSDGEGTANPPIVGEPGDGGEGTGSQDPVTPPAPSYPETITESISVKSGTNSEVVKEALLNEIKKNNSDYAISSVDVSMDANIESDATLTGTVTYADGATSALSLTIKAVPYTGWAFVRPEESIASTSDDNKTASSLLNLANKYRDLTAVGSSDYQNAIGTAPVVTAPALKWTDCNNTYTEAGGTYVFSITYDGQVVTRTIKVSSKSYSIGSLKIDYDTSRVNTVQGMKWSIDRKADKSKWSNCSENMSIPTSWYDKTVYFYIPATKYAEASGVESLYIPPKADKPTEKLLLTSTTHSVTLTNCWDFGNVEFSIDKENWFSTSKETRVWNGLESNTSFTVYARTCADPGDCLASDVISATIKTKETIVTGIDVTQKVTNNNVVISAVATIEPEDSKTQSGSLESKHFTKLNNTLKSAIQKYDDVEIHLVINHFPEANEDYESTQASLTLPMSAIYDAVRNGDMDIEYNTEVGTVYISNSELRDMGKSGTLSLSMQEVTSTPSNSWLKEQYKDGCPVYRLGIKVGSKNFEGSYSIPYELDRNESVAGLSVYRVGTGYKDSKVEVSCNYDPARQAVTFDSSEDAYYTIVSDGYHYVSTLPFYDTPRNFWAYDQILFCYNKGIMVGVTNTTFMPNNNVSKAQVVTMLARMGGCDTTKRPSTSHFTDVSVSDWYAPAAEWAYSKGICTGRTFNGNGPIQRQDIAQLMYLYLTKVGGYDGKVNTSITKEFSDQRNISGNNRTAALYLKQCGVMVGYGKNYFGPTDTVTRAQMAAVTKRMYSIQGMA